MKNPKSISDYHQLLSDEIEKIGGTILSTILTLPYIIADEVTKKKIQELLECAKTSWMSWRITNRLLAINEIPKGASRSDISISMVRLGHITNEHIEEIREIWESIELEKAPLELKCEHKDILTFAEKEVQEDEELIKKAR